MIALLALIIIQSIVITMLITYFFSKKKIVTQNIISIGKVSYFTQNDENILLQFPEAIEAMKRYIDSRIRAVATDMASETFDSTGKEIIKDMPQLYKEK